MSYTAGQTITWGLKTYSSAGVLADVGTGPTGTVSKPDGTSAAATVTKASTGTYTATHASGTLAGRYLITWSGSGANSGGLPFVEVADVWPADPRFIISLADARAALNLPDSARTDDDEIRLYIAATTQVIENLTGPLLGATRVETYEGEGTTALLLSAYPTAITSVVEDGVTLTATDYKLGLGGVLWRQGRAWSTEPGGIVVTFTVGASTVPPNVVLAAREQLRHLWQVGQIASQRPVLGDTVAGITYTPMGFAVPNRVIELLGDQLGRHQPLSVR